LSDTPEIHEIAGTAGAGFVVLRSYAVLVAMRRQSPGGEGANDARATESN